MKTYSKGEVTLVSVGPTSSGSTQVIYQPILDSMYYCPGALVQSVGERKKVSIVRCGINEKCTVNIKSENIGNGRLQLEVSAAPDKIDLVFRDGEISLKPPDK